MPTRVACKSSNNGALTVWSALVVAAFWAVVGAVLYTSGRTQLGQVEGLPRTTETTKQIPPALAGHEETS